MDSTDAPRRNELTRYTPPRPRGLTPHRPAPVEPAETPRALDPGVVVRAVGRRRWLFLFLWVAASAAACAAAQFALKPTFEASSLLRVEPTSQDLFGPAAPNSSASFQDFLETQIELINSPNILLAASSDPQVAGLAEVRKAADPEVVLRKMLRVQVVPRSYLIRVAAWSPSPAGSAGVANAVVNAFLKADAEWSEGMTRHLIRNLDTYNKDLRATVDDKQKAWLELASKGNIEAAAPPSGRTEAAPTGVTIEEYQRVREQLFQAEITLVEAEAHLESLRAELTTADPAADDVRVSHEIRLDPEVADLNDQIGLLETQRAMAARRVRDPNDPSVKSVTYKISHLKARYRELVDLKREQFALRGAAAGADSPWRAVKEAETRVAMLRATKAKLESVLGRLEVTNREQNTDAVKIALIQADLKHLEEMQAAVNRRLEQHRFEARGQARIRRISEARVPTRPSSDKRTVILAAAPLVVLGLLLGAFTLLEVRAGRVHGAGDVSRRVAVEVFTVPPLPAPLQDTPGGELGEQVEAFAHRIDHLREAICGGRSAASRGLCLVVTSAVDGEGKTTLSKHLALRCASGGASTLLIDADLRRATLGQILEMPDGPGLSDVLLDQIVLEDALVPICCPGACEFLSAGSPEANPGRLFQDGRFGAVLERLRSAFDVIIIDTPPILPVPDALTLGRWTDGVILTTRHDVSRLAQVDEANRLLAVAGIPVLGLVVNGVRPPHWAGCYAYGYRSTRYGTTRVVNSDALS